MIPPLTFIIFFEIALIFHCNGQAPASVREIISAVLYHKTVFEVASFNFRGYLEFQPPNGRAAFIIPDTTLQKVYPNVLTDLAYGWGNERMLGTRTIARQDAGAIYVTNHFNGDSSMHVMVQFMRFEIHEKEAIVEFRTISQFNDPEMASKYVWVKAKLAHKSKGWRVINLTKRSTPWCGYWNPKDELYDPYKLDVK